MPTPTQTITVPAHGWRIDPRKALAVAALCWIAFAAIAWLVHTHRAEGIDRAGLLFWRGGDLRPLGPPWILEGVRDLTALGGVLLRNLFAIGALSALLFVRLRREAMLLALTIVSGWVVDDLIKLAVGRPRPEIAPHLTEAGGASFPSGHSFNAAVVYIAIALAFAAISRRESVRVTIIACAISASLAIAWSRVWLGVHWPTDVLAGWLGGVGWAFLATAVLDRPARRVAAQIPESGP
jgi:undecaprenyl-diphosphatase